MKKYIISSLSMVAIATLAVLAGCNSGSNSLSPMESLPPDPRNAFIVESIKKVMTAKTGYDQIAWFKGHPDFEKHNDDMTKHMLMKVAMGNINSSGIDLPKMADIRLKADKAMSEDRKMYCLSGKFSYRGPCEFKGETIDADGGGVIFVCTKDNEKGQLYMSYFKTALDGKTATEVSEKYNAMRKERENRWR